MATTMERYKISAKHLTTAKPAEWEMTWSDRWLPADDRYCLPSMKHFWKIRGLKIKLRISLLMDWTHYAIYLGCSKIVKNFNWIFLEVCMRVKLSENISEIIIIMKHYKLSWSSFWGILYTCTPIKITNGPWALEFHLHRLYDLMASIICFLFRL